MRNVNDVIDDLKGLDLTTYPAGRVIELVQSLERFAVVQFVLHPGKTATQRRTAETLKISRRIENLIKRIDAAKELLLQGDLTGADYKMIKGQCEAKISLLGSKMADSQVPKTTTEQNGSEAYRAIEHLDALYQSLPLAAKKELVELIFITPLIFAKVQFQELRLTEPAHDIYETLNETSNTTNDLLAKLAALSVVALHARPSIIDFTF